MYRHIPGESKEFGNHVNSRLVTAKTQRIFQEELLRSVQETDGDEVFIIVNCGNASQSPKAMTCNIYRNIVLVHICVCIYVILE